MKIAAPALSLLIGVSPAFSAEIMDGSGSEFGDSIAREIAESLLTVTNDPYSAQIIRLHRSTGNDHVLCGLVNLKSPAGGYVGFQPFFFSTESKQIDLRVSSGC